MTVFSTSNSTALQILRGDTWKTSTHLQEPTMERPAGFRLQHDKSGIDPLDKALNDAKAKIAAIVANLNPGETLDLSQRQYSRASVSGLDDATFKGGSGRDFVALHNRANVTTGDGDDGINVYADAFIDSGAGNDSIGTTRNATVFAGSGHDYVYTYENSYVDAGDGDDYVKGYDRMTVFAGAGNDEVRVYDRSTVDAGDGDDLVIAFGHSTIKGGAGNDTLIVSDWSAEAHQLGHAVVDGGEGDDYIQTGKNSVVTGGTGNDFIRLTGAGTTINFGKGDGHDKIVSRDDFTVNLSGYSKDDVTITAEGNDFVVTFKGSEDALTLDISSGAVAKLAFEDGSTVDVVAGKQLEPLEKILATPDWAPSERKQAFFYGAD